MREREWASSRSSVVSEPISGVHCLAGCLAHSSSMVAAGVGDPPGEGAAVDTAKLGGQSFSA